jgi:exopolyphosphatase / guanosine-5'-triphosphate,3'-diphosphate pyrophosphatase
VRGIRGLTDVLARMGGGMRVGVIDVGSNTVRLLVASVGAGGDVRTVREERAHLGLGKELLHHGRIRRTKLDELAEVAGDYARIARKLGVRELETVVTAPGRQGDSPHRLLDTLGRATAGEVRVASAEEEGRLAFAGAVARANTGDAVVAVCDVGGGSTEVVIGTELLGPAWVRSVDVGSLRLTAALLHDDPPTAAQIAEARETVGAAFADLDAPTPELALATGGSARAVARVVGREYGPAELEQVVELLAGRPAKESASALGLRPDRARTLLAGALILSEVSRHLGVPFRPARGGIREGAALRLVSRRVAA